MKHLVCFYLFLLASPVFAQNNWGYLVEDFQARPNAYEHSVISGGASNINYRVKVDGKEYCLRVAPKNTKALYANLEIEYQVLKLLSPLKVSAEPVYFDKGKGILVTEFIPNDASLISLKDPETQKCLLSMLHKIEEANLHIERNFSPYQDVRTMVEKSSQFGTKDFSEDFYTVLLPSLKKIDHLLQKNPKTTLCHLDLHSKNLLQNKERLWIIDWEYATMSHPYLILASMASIERWNDDEMHQLLENYFAAKGETPPQAEDFHMLYLYRITADIFWTAWNHVQAHISPIERPYNEWEQLFYQAAIERLHSEQFQVAVESLK